MKRFAMLVMGAIALSVGSALSAGAEELEENEGGEAPKNEFASPIKNSVGQTIGCECSGECKKGDKCCRPVIHPS